MLKNVRRRGWVNWTVGGFVGILLSTTAACQTQKQAQQPTETPASPASPASPVEEGLVADRATLEQQNEKGQPMWKINAGKATYLKERKFVRLENVTGNLYQDGKPILQIRAKTGEIEEDGKKIVLKEDIVAVDPRNQAVLKTEELEWRPEEDVAIARKNLTGTNANIKASATEGRYESRSQRLELTGSVKAIAKEPALQLRGEKAVWEMAEKKITSDLPLEIERYQEKTVSDRLTANKGQWNLATQVATVQGNVELKSLDPKMQIASNSAVWNLKTRAVQTNQPVQIVHHQEGYSVTGNQGFIDLEQQVVRLQGGAQGSSLRKQAKIYANQLVWQISQQLLQAEGNVVYDQSDPPLHLTGPKATGNLETQQISVASETKGQVVTEITP
ncbi:MAG: LPS export ABC transporter periplasmic protein LptC [Cyanobacteriota bacterium]|nr:LPS export ABC transporter periplasmic protein LptC [Cyanobacteriota bacterium]